jgi:outer membrane biosynthesis protein TonB
MRQTAMALVALLLLWPGVSHAAFQEPAQKTPATTTEPEQAKSEVELALKEAEKRGETVLAACLENCKEDDRDKQEGLERGRALVLPKPVYPTIAAQAHAAGQVQVKVLIGLDGKVIAAAAIEGHPLLQFTSVRAARDATFTPTKLNGKPVKVVGVIVYNFVSQ